MKVHRADTVAVQLHDGPDVSVHDMDDDFWGHLDKETNRHEGRLVLSLPQRENWRGWQRHPDGEEILIVVAGRLRFHYDDGGDIETTDVGPNDVVIVPTGVWHTADVLEAGLMVAITRGAGTEYRPR